MNKVPNQINGVFFGDDETVNDLLDEANEDTDAVSLTWLLPKNDLPANTTRMPDEPIAGVVVVIKGDAVAREFEAWARANGYITPGKPIVGDAPMRD